MLKKHDSAVVRASPERIWPYISDPDLISFWNGKLVKVNCTHSDSVTVGETFEAQYQMSRSGGESKVEVTRCEPPLLVEYHHRIFSRGKSCEVTESYEIRPKGDESIVCQTINLGWGAIPWWAVPLVWLISLFGKPHGKTNMEVLADLVVKEISA